MTKQNCRILLMYFVVRAYFILVIQLNDFLNYDSVSIVILFYIQKFQNFNLIMFNILCRSLKCNFLINN